MAHLHASLWQDRDICEHADIGAASSAANYGQIVGKNEGGSYESGFAVF